MAGEKRSQEQEETMLSQTTILVDIEGTTTSISFVKETLFPYVRENLKKYIDTNWDDDKFKQDYHKLKEQAKKDEEDKVEGFIPIVDSNMEEEKESLMKNILWQMDNDRKTGALKQLQGHMWQEAYKSTAIKGHVYDDVPKALESWMNDGKKIYVYSSGSVEAQKLLFGNSEQGDLLKYFSGFFDTEIGAKQECDSYKNILSKIGEKPDNVIFLTDIVREAAAAKEAGLLPVIVIREGNATLTDEETVAYMTIKSLLDLTFQTSTKRQKLNPTEPEEKNDSVSPKSSEPMDTSEDVEMSDASGKKTEKTEITKSPQPEQEIKAQTEEKDQISSKKDESTKDIKDVETVTNVKPDEKEPSTAKQPEIPTKVGVTSVVDDTMDVARNEPISKPTEDTKDTKSEIILQNETVKVVKDDKTRDESVTEKSVERTSAEKNETKVEGSTNKAVTSSSTTEKNNSEAEETIIKTTQVSTKVENAPLTDTTKNSDNIAKIDTDKAAVSTETEVKDTKNDLKDQENNVATEKSTEVETKSEKIEEESKKAQSEKENVEIKPSLTKVEKHTESAESIEQESSKESVKEETVLDEVKDKSTVESEKKKLNGTTQNGDDVPVSDENLHRNGLNEASSSEQLVLTSSEETPAQNGEPESSTDTSAESIKVKKVVDSAVADGAGEPDVVPPVVVAATS
uniref:enolase-phosphatase E1 isoform X1 n=1 Tax=Vespula vulgaris TaxID=7454 RepID=UPI00223AF73D|nr:enolase-phosphatase E1 isoform X1 [Vespula vulgaris]